MTDSLQRQIRRGEASTLNPSAGMHPVSLVPAEVEAAARAGDASIAEFPYFRDRYGERGERFALSDGSWLVTLADSEEEGRIVEEVRWLGRVLSSRGMPVYLLERHLRHLERELIALSPEREASYRRLGETADRLTEARRARLGDDDFRRLSSRFDAAVPDEFRDRLPRMGEVVVSAVIDESEGIVNAVPSLLSWAADPARFPREWIGAVERTLAEAREAIAAGGGAVGDDL
jgi:hypothetical protein